MLDSQLDSCCTHQVICRAVPCCQASCAHLQDRKVQIAMWLSFVANMGLLVAKLYGFWLSHSYSVLASAADSLVDILSQASKVEPACQALECLGSSPKETAAVQLAELLPVALLLRFTATRHKVVASCNEALIVPQGATLPPVQQLPHHLGPTPKSPSALYAGCPGSC